MFTVLGQIDETQWAENCSSGGNEKCALTEDTGTRSKTTSEWAWNADDRCNYTTGENADVVSWTCQMLGLRGWDADADGNFSAWGSTGLIQSTTAWKGTVRDAGGSTAEPTGMEATLETANYEFDKDGGDTKMK